MVQLTISRMRPGITDPDEILLNRSRLQDYPVTVDREHIGVLYVKPSSQHPPPWLDFFSGSVDIDVPVVTASSSAVLLLRHAGSVFAIPFGHGHALINNEVEDAQFGLKTTLNAVEPTQLRAIDHRRLESNPRHVREQLSKAAGLEQFGIDVERDLLRAVTGKPADRTLGEQMSGRERLVVNVAGSVRDLRNLLERYDQISREKTYADAFGFIDNIVAEADPATLHELERQLVILMRERSDGVWLAAPEIIEAAAISAFRYRSGRAAQTFSSIDIDDYYSEMGRDFNAADLRNDRLRCIQAADGAERPTWSIHKCVVAELSLGNDRWILSEGTWYRIEERFLTQVEDAVAQLQPSKVFLPEFTDDDEPAYAHRVWQSNKSELAHFDRDLVYPGGRTAVEVCDLYSRHRAFVHLKRCEGSRVLSHLFNQGVVSAQLFANERSFRVAFHDKLPSSHRWGNPGAAVNPSEFEVAYGLIARRGRAVSIPFFSKVALRNAARILGAMGFRVAVSGIAAPHT